MPKHIEIEFYHVLGGFIARYGFIDALIADMCKELFENLGGHPSVKHPPQTMSKRRELISKCYRDKPELTANQPIVANLLATIDEIDFIRHYIVHGCQTDFFPEAQAYQFTKVDRRDDNSGYTQTSITLTHDQLAQITQAGTHVVRGLTPIGKHLKELSALKNGEQQS